jgi:hypothetical protein
MILYHSALYIEPQNDTITQNTITSLCVVVAFCSLTKPRLYYMVAYNNTKYYYIIMRGCSILQSDKA